MHINKFLYNFISAATIIFLTACSGKYKSKLDFSASESIRVAVLPFIQVNEKNETIEPDHEFLIDKVSTSLSETPSVYVKKLVQNELRSSGLDILPSALIEANLSHKGFDDMTKLPPIDVDKANKASATQLCSEVFSCDAVLYGKITRWSRSYYGIQSVNTVGIDIKLVSAKDGRVMFSSSAEDSDSRGISKGPTGFSDLVIAPLEGLDNKIIIDLARKVVKKMVSPLMVENRPEFLDSFAPAIYASAHDASAGSIKRKIPLTVLAFGSPNDTASFSIGNVIENIPMVEKDKGHYIGKYFPLPSDTFSNQSIYVALTDEFGRATRQKISTATVSLE